MNDVPAYPLQWPAGWPRTAHRRPAAFKTASADGWSKRSLTLADARGRLGGELNRLGARLVTLSTNVELRLDGQPYSNRGEPADPGAAVYFQLAGNPIVLACDKWNRVADNVAALAKHIEAMRGQERWGVGTAAQAFAGYVALPAPDPWWQTLGLSGPSRSEREIRDAYRRASASAHPDRPGGSHDKMAALNVARDKGLESII